MLVRQLEQACCAKVVVFMKAPRPMAVVRVIISSLHVGQAIVIESVVTAFGVAVTAVWLSSNIF